MGKTLWCELVDAQQLIAHRPRLLPVWKGTCQMLKNQSWSRRLRFTVVLWAALAVPGFGPLAHAVETVFTDDVRIKTATPQLFFETTGFPYQWEIFPDGTSFDIIDVTSNTNRSPFDRARRPTAFSSTTAGTWGWERTHRKQSYIWHLAIRHRCVWIRIVR